MAAVVLLNAAVDVVPLAQLHVQAILQILYVHRALRHVREVVKPLVCQHVKILHQKAIA